MGRVNPVPGQGFAIRLVLLKADAQDGIAMPSAAYDGGIETIIPNKAWCYRKEGDRVFCVWKVAVATISTVKYILTVVYAPAPSRDTVSVFTAIAADIGADLVKSWNIQVGAGGTILVPALDADNTAIGTGVKANWPTTWRVWQAGDTTTPTGARCIAEQLA